MPDNTFNWEGDSAWSVPLSVWEADLVIAQLEMEIHEGFQRGLRLLFQAVGLPMNSLHGL